MSPDEKARSGGDLKQCVKGKQCVKTRRWDRPRVVKVDRSRVVEVDRPRVVEVERSGKPKTEERKTCSQKWEREVEVEVGSGDQNHGLRRTTVRDGTAAPHRQD